ncbi:MAG: deoxynucleoside kinase, partial [Haliscomenobacter sp.]
MKQEHTPNQRVKYVAIAGNIGAGKTTLCTQLGRTFGWEVHYESTDNNPYLIDFYNDMRRWSFNLQIFFLHNRYRQILKILQGEHTVIQDRTIYE